MAEGLNLDVAQVRVCLDAGFKNGETLRAMDARDIAYPGRPKTIVTSCDFTLVHGHLETVSTRLLPVVPVDVVLSAQVVVEQRPARHLRQQV